MGGNKVNSESFCFGLRLVYGVTWTLTSLVAANKYEDYNKNSAFRYGGTRVRGRQQGKVVKMTPKQV